MMEASTTSLLELGLTNDAKGFQSLHTKTCDFLVVLAAEANRILISAVHRSLVISIPGARQVLLHNQKALLIDDDRLCRIKIIHKLENRNVFRTG